MEKIKSWEIITSLGKDIKRDWQNLADLHNIKIKQNGIPALANFSFESKNNLLYKTYITQEMLKSGFLAGNSIYVSTTHSKKIINRYFDKLDLIFRQIKKCEEEEMDINSLLIGKVCHETFKRLN